MLSLTKMELLVLVLQLSGPGYSFGSLFCLCVLLDPFGPWPLTIPIIGLEPLLLFSLLSSVALQACCYMPENLPISIAFNAFVLLFLVYRDNFFQLLLNLNLKIKKIKKQNLP